MQGIAVAILLLCCTAASAAQPATPSLNDLIFRSGRRSGRQGSVSTASVQQGYEYKESSSYEMQTKEVCLADTNWKYCDEDNTGNFGGYFWTTDMQCCSDESEGYGNAVQFRNNQLWSAGSNNVGSCDWYIAYSFYIDVSATISKVGMAWATCYFGPEAEECGGPLCDRLIMSLQGTAYYAYYAYSYYGMATLDDFCTSIYPRGLREARNRNTTTATDAQPLPGAAESPRGARGKAGKARKTRKNRRGAPSAKKAPAHMLNNYGSHDSSDRIIYEGEATIIMGIVNSLAGQRKEKWDEGTFEYVPYWFEEVASNDAGNWEGVDPSAPWIRDKTLKLTFFKHPEKY